MEIPSVVNRREFLKKTVGGGTALLISFHLSPGAQAQESSAAQEMLVTAAAARWNVNPNTCKAQDGGVLHGARKNFFTYGELVADAAQLPVPDFKTVALKNSNEFTIVGHDIRRYEGVAKTTGAAKYGIDSRVP